MAVEKTIKIKADTSEAVTNVEQLNTEINATDEATVAAESGFVALTGTINAAGLAFKALGVGLIVSAFIQLKELLGQNQVVMDKLSIAGETVGAVFQKIIQAAVEVGQKLTSAFTDPKQAIKDLWTALKQNIVNRVEGMIDLFGAFGRIIKGVFTMNLGLIKEGTEEASVAFVQMNTGLDAIQQSKAAETMSNIWQETKKATKEANEYGKAITNLRKEVKLAEANQRQLQLTYQRDAEIQRQIRDDVSRTIEERIEANEELGRVLQKQFEEEKALAQKKIDLAQMEFDQNKGNVDLEVALINAKTEMADLEERITGQKSEQMTNLNALAKEQTDAELAALKKIADTKKAKDQKEEEDAKKLAAHKEQVIKDSVSAVVGLLGKESKAGKAILIGQALRDTYAGVNKAIGQGGFLGFLQAGAILATGLSNVAKIKSTGDDGSGGGGSSPSPPAMADGPSGMSLNAPNIESILGGGGDGATPPVQAYVVENDISNAQALQEELETQATL